MQQQGLTNVALQIERIAWSESRISTLNFTYQDESALAKVQLKEILLTYDWNSLSTKQLKQVHVDNIQLSITGKSEPTTALTLPSLAPFIELLKQDLAVYFPLQQAQFSDVEFIYSQGENQQVAYFQGELTKQEKKLLLELGLRDGRKLNAILDPNNDWHVSLLTALEETAMSSEFGVGADQDSLEFDVDLTPALLKSWLPELVELDSLSAGELNLKGRLKGQLNSSKEEEITANVVLMTPSLSYQEWEAQTVQGEIVVRVIEQAVEQAVEQVVEQGKGLKIILEPTTQLSVAQLSNKDWLAEAVLVSVSAETTISNDEFVVTGLKSELSLGKVQQRLTEEPITLEPEPLSLIIEQAWIKESETEERLFVEGRFQSRGVNVQQGEYSAQLDEIDQTFELNEHRIKMHGQLRESLRNIDIKTALEHSLETEQGTLQATVATIAFPQNTLTTLLQPLDKPLKIVAGKVSPVLTAKWHQKEDQTWSLKANTQVVLDNLGGAYEDLYFSDLSAKLSFPVYPEIASKRTQTIKIAYIDSGIVARNLVLQFNLLDSNGPLPRVKIKVLKADVLDGFVALQPVVIDLNKSQYKLALELNKINLDQLVELQQLDDIRATGLISGVLPIIIKDEKIKVDQGKLEALKPGGIIQYSAADLGETNQYAEQVVEILRNFHYQVLSSETNYKPDGTLLLKLALQGNNPEYEGGRQVNLNINLEQNILKLFESLRLVEGINDKLDQRVQKYYQQQSR